MLKLLDLNNQNINLLLCHVHGPSDSPAASQCIPIRVDGVVKILLIGLPLAMAICLAPLLTRCSLAHEIT